MRKLILEFWLGKRQLWEAFWLIHIAGLLILHFIFKILSQLVDFQSLSIGWLYFVIILSVCFASAYYFFSIMVIRRCHKNVKQVFWGKATKIYSDVLIIGYSIGMVLLIFYFFVFMTVF